MATQTVTVSGGGRLAASRARTAVLSCGVGLGIGSLPWNTRSAARTRTWWIPPAHVPFLTPQGQVTQAWYRYLAELGDRLGGIQGETIPQVVTTITQTQAQVVATANYTEQAVQYTRAVAATAEATAQVAQDSGLDGADTIPPAPEPPTRPTSGTSAL